MDSETTMGDMLDWSFVIGVGGIYATYLVYGLLQEWIYS
jgi:hypothetical protein